MKVIQDWFQNLPYKMQSVLISAQRGPDNRYCENIKKVTKWVRRTCQINADPSHTFMENVPLPSIDEIEYELEFCTMHYVAHFIQGLEIIAYKHPEPEVRERGMYYYKGITCELFHLNIEEEIQLDKRLIDKIKK